jgi:mannosylglycerate hydrolase MGH1-like protein
LLNFTWWVNRKDEEGNNVFQGGFLGLDNIGVFDRSQPLPTGGHLEQSDGTSWMGMFCLNMLTIALELAINNRVYEDIATKFFEHFLYIAAAMNEIGSAGIALWDEQDEFFYDVLHLPTGENRPLRIRSMVGLIPLFAVTTIEPALLEQLPEFRERLEWFPEHRPQMSSLVSRWQEPGLGERRLLAICRGHRMKRVLRRMLDEGEFLSPYGVRALSRVHAAQPYVLDVGGARYTVEYLPAESNSPLFGGNSNWRGPIWFPVNYLIIESLQQFHHYYGDDFKVECPTGSGQLLTLREIADELSRRLMRIFLRGADGQRAAFGGNPIFQQDPHWRDYIMFYEYFHGDTGAGVGASHQTGWTGLIAKLIQQQGERPPA